MLKENPIIVTLDPKAVCRHTRSRPLNIKGVSHMRSSIQKKNYMEKHISLPTDFWIASIRTIQDQRIEDIYQEADDRISEMTKTRLLVRGRGTFNPRWTPSRVGCTYKGHDSSINFEKQKKASSSEGIV